MHNLCVFCTFSTFAQRICKGWGWNFKWSFRKVMRTESMKMVFVANISRHKLYIIYVFFYVSLFKIILVQKLFYDCCNKFDYPGSAVYLSCSMVIQLNHVCISWPTVPGKFFICTVYFFNKMMHSDLNMNLQMAVRNSSFHLSFLWIQLVITSERFENQLFEKPFQQD